MGENWLQGSFDRVLVARSWLRGTKCDPLAKIRGGAGQQLNSGHFRGGAVLKIFGAGAVWGSRGGACISGIFASYCVVLRNGLKPKNVNLK